MRWLMRILGFLVDCVCAVPVVLWRGLTGYVPPDPWQAAAEAMEVQEEVAADAETEGLMEQIDAAHRRLAARDAVVAAKAQPVAERLGPPMVVMEPANDDDELEETYGMAM